jgi:hypothetical protein
MNSEQVIHIKLESNEALNSKRQVLNTESSLLKLKGAIQRYHKLRSNELKQKARLQRTLKEYVAEINKLSILLPQIKIPRKLQEDYVEEKQVHSFPKLSSAKREFPQESKYDNKIESQLREIQAKLNSLK